MNRTTFNTKLGTMMLAESQEGLVGAWFLGQRYFPKEAESWTRKRSQLLTEAKNQVLAYFSQELEDFDLPLARTGTDFQRAVWKHLRAIPYGQLSSYGKIAQLLSRASAARAVAMATSRNPWSVIIPCHRVLAGNGDLAGFAGGLWRKRWLLQMERNVQ